MRGIFWMLLPGLVLAACTSQAAPSPSIPTATQTVPPTPAFTPSSLPTQAPSLTPSPPPTPTATPLPEEHIITTFTGHHQFYPLGCEASCAVDWADYFGVFIYQSEFQYSLPLSDNPDLGFVGSVRDPWGQVPPYSYGVHAGPVAEVLRSYGLNAAGVKGFTMEQLKAEIASNQPVIAWVIGNCVGGVAYEYTDKTGSKVTVAAYEHTIVVTGYGPDTIRYNNNGRYYEVPTEVFLNSWGVLGNMVVYFDD